MLSFNDIWELEICIEMPRNVRALYESTIKDLIIYVILSAYTLGSPGVRSIIADLKKQIHNRGS